MVSCQNQQSTPYRPYFIKHTAKFQGYHLCCFHFLIFYFSWLRRFYPSRFMSKTSLYHVSVIKCSQIRKSCRNTSIIGVSSLVKQSDLDYRTNHLNFCNKERPAGMQHNCWHSRSSELCCACRTSSIVTTLDCKKVFEAYARIFCLCKWYNACYLCR